MSSTFIIFGVGDLAEVAYSYATADYRGEPSRFKPSAFTCDEAYIPHSRRFFGLPVVPFSKPAITTYWDDVCESTDGHSPKLLIPISFRELNGARMQKYEIARSWNFELITYIHPSAVVDSQVPIGDNCFIADLVSVQPRAKIGCNTVIRSLSYIGHHASVGDHCWISAGASICGKARVGDRCFVGAGAIIRDEVEIAYGNVIGMGAVITRSTKPGEVYLSGVNNLSSQPSLAAESVAQHQLVR